MDSSPDGAHRAAFPRGLTARSAREQVIEARLKTLAPAPTPKPSAILFLSAHQNVGSLLSATPDTHAQRTRHAQG